MFYTYVIKNNKGDIYKGHSDNVQRRISEHNRGNTKSTRKGSDWQLKYCESFDTREEAIKKRKIFEICSRKKILKEKNWSRTRPYRTVRSGGVQLDN